ETGTVATLAGTLREPVARLLPGVRGRRFYEALLRSSEAEAAVAAGSGRAAAEALLAAHGAAPSAPGTVALVGAGPGAEDLLTLRAQRLLQEADVIVHDQLVPAAVVGMGRRDAERIAVGKRPGHH